MCEMSISRNGSLVKLINPSCIKCVLTRHHQPQIKVTSFIRQRINIYGWNVLANKFIRVIYKMLQRFFTFQDKILRGGNAWETLNTLKFELF